MDISYYVTLYDYYYWANRRVWDCAMQLSDEDYMRPVEYAQGSIHALFVHLMDSENVWFRRLRGVSPAALATPEAFPTRDALRMAWDVVERYVRAQLLSMTDADLMRVIQYQRTTGEAQSNPVWVALTQVANHGTDHRALILHLIHQFGGPTVPQDFIVYWRESQR